MKKGVCGIYCIENIHNHKKWIGYSCDMRRRWWEHRYDLKNNQDSEFLQNDYNIFGVENFNYYIIEECEISELKDREQYYIDAYNTMNRAFGYNKTKGGDGIKGYSFNEESRLKKSLLAKGRKGKTPSPESIAKMVAKNKGQKRSQEVKDTLSLVKMGNQYAKGCSRSDEFKSHLSEINKNRPIIKTSKYRGVHYDKKRNKYIAQIRDGGEKIFLGIFKKEEDAALAYNNASIKLKGNSAKLNIIKDEENE